MPVLVHFPVRINTGDTIYILSFAPIFFPMHQEEGAGFVEAFSPKLK